MKRFSYPILVIGSVLAFVIPTHSQDTCANYMVTGFSCRGPNNCNQYVTLLEPYFGSVQYCLEETIVWCCNGQYGDYDVGGSCTDTCDDAVRALLKDPIASEFAMTHTLWVKDCSGRYRPFARSWDAPEKPFNPRSRLPLSGIGG